MLLHAKVVVIVVVLLNANLVLVVLVVRHVQGVLHARQAVLEFVRHVLVVTAVLLV